MFASISSGTRGFMVPLVLFSLMSVPASYGTELDFEVTDLKVNGVVTGVLTGDFNGDGRVDLLILHRVGSVLDVKRSLSVFYQWEDGNYSTAADRSWEEDSLVQGIALEPGGRDTATRILTVRSGGVFRHDFTDGLVRAEETRIISHRTFFLPGQADKLVPLSSFCDMDSAGTRWVVLPCIDRMVLYEGAHADTYEPVDSIAYRLTSRVTTLQDNYVAGGTQRLRQTLVMPMISRASLSPAGRNDFVIMYEGRVEEYVRGEAGFPALPSAGFDYNLATSISRQNDGYILRPALHDLNGDGYSDLIVTRQEAEGLSGFKTVLDIYSGPLLHAIGSSPSQRMMFDDAISYFISFIDLDGDGRLELAVPVVKLGIFDIIRILTTRSLRVTVNIYTLGENDQYQENPRYVHEIKAGLDLKAGAAGEVIGKVVNLNGDRFKDLVISLDPNRLSVFLGEGGRGPRFFRKRVSATLESHPDVEILARDLTGNGLDDLITSFGSNPKGAGLIRIFTNRTTPSSAAN